VLNSQDLGKTSDLLKALGWILLNRTTYNIRVANMSLGTLAVDSYKNDPLCIMAWKLVDSGIVAVAAAGNNGKNSSDQKIYGNIHSPATSRRRLLSARPIPTERMRAMNDVITSYSSRGPTRSYWTDSSGVKHYDNIIKPDLVAPGNKLLAAQSPGNLLVANNPALNANVSNDQRHEMMTMSGTSMATPMVAGAAAILLQANPKLMPNMVKMILQYTAQPLAGFNTLEQGTGQLNIEVRLD
jgi:subtilisin family serine protease